MVVWALVGETRRDLGGGGVKGRCLGKVKGGDHSVSGDPVGREKERNGGMMTSIRWVYSCF